jgi:hypothetical protein
MTTDDQITAILASVADRDLYPMWALTRLFVEQGWMTESEAERWKLRIFEEMEIREIDIDDVAPMDVE